MAEQVITDFVRALRASDVRVSTAEAIDAAAAVKLVGYGDRTCLRDTLRCVLAKSSEEKQVHDRLFDLYFSRQDTSPVSPPETLPPDASEPPDTPPDILTLSQTGDAARIAMALEQAGQSAGVQDIRFSTQIAYYAQRMLQAMGLERLEAEMMAGFRARSAEGTARAEALIAARSDMQARARRYAQQAFETYGAGATLAFREEVLSETALTALDMRDMDRMRQLVEKIARRLAVKHSRRARKRNHGQLNVRKTLRANSGFDGVPFDLHWKQTRRDRARIVAICDVSGSVSRVVRVFLMLLYSLNEVVSEIESFAFSGRLERVSDTLDTQNFGKAMDQIIHRIGMSSTDYGQSLSDLKCHHWSTIDRRTTVIILGDGRSNYGDPRLDLFRELSARAKRTVWLTPEGESQWGSGDSELPRYRPYCNAMRQITTIRDLERVIDATLAIYH